jgi:hypothetical protein
VRRRRLIFSSRFPIITPATLISCPYMVSGVFNGCIIFLSVAVCISIVSVLSRALLPPVRLRPTCRRLISLLHSALPPSSGLGPPRSTHLRSSVRRATSLTSNRRHHPVCVCRLAQPHPSGLRACEKSPALFSPKHRLPAGLAYPRETHSPAFTSGPWISRSLHCTANRPGCGRSSPFGHRVSC